MIPSSRRSAEGFVDRSANPMQEVERLLSRSLRRAGKPVLFLIDDLDRCDAEYVVEFLEAVQTLLRDAWHSLPTQDEAGPYALIAADGQWIGTSYEKHYARFSATSLPGRPNDGVGAPRRLPALRQHTQPSEATNDALKQLRTFSNHRGQVGFWKSL
jgi:hypothetical protein